jgi:hypothetical protein
MTSSFSVTQSGSVIIRSWPVSISQNRHGRSADQMRFRDGAHGRLVPQDQLLGEAGPRLGGQPLIGPLRQFGIVDAEEPCVERLGLHDQFHAIFDVKSRAQRIDAVESVLVQRFAIEGICGVEIDAVAHAVRRAVRHARDHHPAVAVPDQDRVVQVFIEQQRRHIVDMGIEIDAGMKLTGVFAHPRQGGRVDDVAGLLQPTCHELVAPPAMPATMDQNESRHMHPPYVIN